jgi:O-antigen/teichoic acid export membrane protein
MKIIRAFLNKGSDRTVIVKKNVISIFLIKSISVLTSFLLVPLTIDYVNPYQYGIWLTLSSVVAWLSFFDIGFGNGFRNKFSIAVANGDHKLAKIYVSTIYTYLSIIFFSVWAVFILINTFIDWNKVLNFDVTLENEISLVAIIIFTYFCLQFVLNIISTILLADQKTAKSSIISVLGQVLSLIIIYILTKFSSGSLVYLAISLCISPLIILIIANIWFFQKKYKIYKPSLKLAKIKYAKDILDLGGKFFVIQIAGIVQYQSSNFLIAYYFGPDDVTAYNIAFKYFSILMMVFMMLLTPFWSAVTDAYTKKDIKWIKQAVKKYLIYWFFFTIGGIVMLYFSTDIYDLWIGPGKVKIPFIVSFWTAAFIVTSLFSGIFVTVINGIGALKIQFYLCFITPLIFISLSYFLINFYSYGLEAILISSVVANVTGIIFIPLQYIQIMRGKKGVWVK